MALFILKPILWNKRGYEGPSGVRANSGFPKKYGYGHEEWNNSPRMRFTIGEGSFNVFHTEGIGRAPVHQNVGQTFVFMTASHDGRQELVGIGANATCLIGEEETIESKHGIGALRMERERLVRLLHLQNLWRDAWAVQRVKDCHGGDREKFLDVWRGDAHWIPNWICSSDFFWWLPQPVQLNAQEITGEGKLLTMFGRYTPLSIEQAGVVMNSVPIEARQNEWHRIMDAVGVAPNESMTWGQIPDTREPITSRLVQAQSRIGQGPFRAALMAAWNECCAVTGLQSAALLRASHIKPWSESSANERVSADNGLLLSANLDALFDKGWISFEDSGSMMVSPLLSEADVKQLGLPKKLRKPLNAAQRKFLDDHRRRYAAILTGQS